MFCGRYRRRLIPYVEGSLAPAEQEKVARHVTSCEACSREIESLRVVHLALRQAKAAVPEPTSELRSRIMAQLSEHARLPRRRFAIGMAAASAISGAIIAGVIVLHSPQMPLRQTPESDMSGRIERVQPGRALPGRMHEAARKPPAESSAPGREKRLKEAARERRAPPLHPTAIEKDGPVSSEGKIADYYMRENPVAKAKRPAASPAESAVGPTIGYSLPIPAGAAERSARQPDETARRLHAKAGKMPLERSPDAALAGPEDNENASKPLETRIAPALPMTKIRTEWKRDTLFYSLEHDARSPDGKESGETADRLCLAGSGAAESSETAVDIITRSNIERVKVLFTY